MGQPLGSEFDVTFPDGSSMSIRIKPTVMSDETMEALLSLDRKNSRKQQLEAIKDLKEELAAGNVSEGEYENIRKDIIKQMADPEASFDPTDQLKRFSRALSTKEGMKRALLLNSDDVTSAGLAEKIYQSIDRWELFGLLVEAASEGQDVKNSPPPSLPSESVEQEEVAGAAEKKSADEPSLTAS